jgi:ethanolamine utilization protein EutN
MFIARVIAPVVATEKHAFFAGRKLLLVKELLPGGGLGERVMVALDCVQAGPGDRVLVARNGGAVDDVIGLKDCPANVVIVGQVDRVNRRGEDAEGF